MSVIAALALLAAGTPGTTGRWWYLFSDVDMAWFADALTRDEVEGMVTMSYETYQRVPKANGTASSATRSLFDCRRRMTATISAVAFDTKGNMIGKAHAPRQLEWHAVYPDSNGESLWLFACAPVREWRDLEGIDVFRTPDRVARDFYWLFEQGLRDTDAIALARLDRKTRLSEISAFIHGLTGGTLRAKLLDAYGLAPDPSI